jgi:CBS domain-containing protein
MPMNARSSVSEIMTRTVVVVRPKTRLDLAARLMRESHVAGLPVVDEDEALVGLVSEDDIVRDLDRAVGVASPRGILDLVLGSAPVKGASTLEVCRRRLAHGRVEEVMQKEVSAAAPDDPIRKVARLLAGAGVSRVPVVDERRQVIGIVTNDDLAKAGPGARKPSHRGALHPPPARTGHPRTPGDPFADI